MTGEMYWLALSALVCLVIWIPYTSLYGGIAGVREGTTNIPQTQKLPDWAQRNHRAHMNLVETLVPFAILILMLKATGQTDASTATAAMIFFFARVAHVVVYTMGIPYIRTAAFTISWLVCLYLLWQLLT